MSYDPQSGGETQPTGGGETQPTGDQPMGGQPTQPTGDFTTPAGGYAPPPPPPPPSGGYTPPPQGGYTPPPQGGYTPPPQGGYTPPPPAGGYGGYSAPPPPPPPAGGMGTPAGGPSFAVGNMGTVNQATLQDLFRSYMNAITKPNVSTYLEEIPKASWLRTLIGVSAVAIVSFLVSLVSLGAASVYYSQIRQTLIERGYTGPDFFSVAGAGGIGGAIGSLIFTFVWFFVGAGLLWLMARLFGGTGSDFMTHSYLLSISYTPLRIIAGVIGIIPFLGGLVALIAYIYQLYSASLALEASQRMAPGRARMAVFLPLIVGIALGCVCFLILFFVILAAVSNVSNP